jgi:hypothetical protein
MLFYNRKENEHEVSFVSSRHKRILVNAMNYFRVCFLRYSPHREMFHIKTLRGLHFTLCASVVCDARFVIKSIKFDLIFM